MEQTPNAANVASEAKPEHVVRRSPLQFLPPIKGALDVVASVGSGKSRMGLGHRMCSLVDVTGSLPTSLIQVFQVRSSLLKKLSRYVKTAGQIKKDTDRMNHSRDDSILFDDCEIDLRRAELRRSGHVVPVEPQVFDLIAFLASRPGEVLSRDDIVKAIWDGRAISESVISTRINAARKALGDDGKSQRIIRTAPRKGYVFVPEVSARDESQPGRTTDVFDRERSRPGKASVAVLPFANMSGDTEQTFFSDGITDDIITELSRYEELFVIARHSSFMYRDRRQHTMTIAKELGVQYIIEGSVRRFGNQIRVAVQLIDALAGNELWAERYDRELEDIFQVQDEIAAVIVNTLVGKLAYEHTRGSLLNPTRTMDAHHRVLRSMVLFQRFTPSENQIARAEAEQAIASEPNFARAHAMVSWTRGVEGSLRWVTDPPQAYRLALDSADRAIALNELEPWGHSAAGYAEIMCNRAYAKGLAAHERSVQLNPNNAHFRSWYAIGLCFAGYADRALEEMDLAMRLNPHYPPIYLNLMGRILFVLGRYEDALRYLERMAAALPHNPSGQAIAAACYVALDRMDEAQAMIDRVLKAAPDYRIAVIHHSVPYARSEDLDFYCDLLQKAGLPD